LIFPHGQVLSHTVSNRLIASTQCPQYVLEDALINGKGADTRIIVTQPRKIAAISVAERVAAERLEGIGHSIGYTVRFNRKSPRESGGSVEFVTTGVLLRRLVNDPLLAGCSHVAIDEVHERDIQTDFLLVLLKDLLKARSDLRVILMSATLDADSFGEYFKDFATDAAAVRVLKVPAKPRHPVEVFYLEDLIGKQDSGPSFSKSKVAKLAAEILQYNDQQLRIELEDALEEEEASGRLQALSRAEDEGEDLDSDSESSDSDSDGEESHLNMDRIDTLRRALALRDDGQWPLLEMKLSHTFDPRDAVIKLVCELVQDLCDDEINAGRSGSILCFLPGWDEIKAATEAIAEASGPRTRQYMTILPLHSTIPHDDQKKVFEPADGKIKVILATNIAESSVTIDDVLAVVDTGLVREMNFSAEANVTAMETNKTSQASATQRLGRAGRVAAGKCYRLYSRGDFEAMPARPTPEIQRTALEATCLQICSMTNQGVEKFLEQALDPPPKESISLAMERLSKLGAINVVDGREFLSPLGICLSRLPLDPATGRMLLMGVVNKCLDPLLTSAACFSSRSIFVNPPGLRDRAMMIRRSFSDTSDVMAMVEAYNTFWDIVEQDGWQAAKDWAFDNYISVTGMLSVKAVRSQLLDELQKIGMIPGSDLQARRMSRKACLVENASVNENSQNSKLFSAHWAVAFPDNLAARRKLGSFGTLRTRTDSHAGLHPSSVGFHRKPPQDKGARRDLPAWYLFQEKVLSSQLFLRGSSAMEPEQLLLFGGYHFDSLRGSHVHGLLDDWIAVESPCPETVRALSVARKEINRALEYKVMYPKASLPAETQEVLDCVADFLNEDWEADDND
jgi:HrpA-like RNA helicase